jgi:hypothetical protein
MDLLLECCVLTDQLSVSPLNPLIRVGQLCLLDPQVLDQLTRLKDGVFLLSQRSLQTIDIVRETTRTGLFCLEVLTGLLLSLLRGALGNFTLQELLLQSGIIASSGSKV